MYVNELSNLIRSQTALATKKHVRLTADMKLMT